MNMKPRVSLKTFLPYLVLLAMIFLLIIDATFKLVSIQYNFKTVLLVVLITIVYIYLITGFKFGFISIVFLFIIPRPICIIKYIYRICTELGPFMESVALNQYVTKAYASYFTNLVYILIPIAIIIFYYIVVMRRSTVPVLIIGSVVFVTYYFLGSSSAYDSCSKYLFFTFILYGYNNYMKQSEKWTLDGVSIVNNHFERWLSTVIILTFVTGILIRILPYNFKSASGNLFNGTILGEIENFNSTENTKQVNDLYRNAFDLSYTGFQENPIKLGGSIKLDNKEVMRIYSDDHINELRLRGRVSDIYTGDSWQRGNKELIKYEGAINIPEINIPSDIKKIKVYPDSIYTTTVFNVLYTNRVFNKWNYVYVSSDFEIFNPKKPLINHEYEINCRDYNFKSYYLDNLTSFLAVKENKKNLSNYLRLPNTIPSRVYKLVDQITSKYDTPYKKASAIENYLKKNYIYDLNTSKLPKHRDFVDYFLFTEKKGYCTYYATSMAVMCRMASIPSRYVEGFFTLNKQDNDGYIYVHNSDAHAWVELYFDNVGWVPFDPTPGNPSNSIDLSKLQNKSTASIVDADKKVNINEDNLSKNIVSKNREIEEKDAENVDGKGKNIKQMFVVLIFIIILILMLGYVIIKKYLASNKRILEYSFFKLTLCGKLIGMPYMMEDTMREYLKRVGDKLNIKVNNYINLLEITKYSTYELKEKDYIDIKRLIKVFEKDIKKHSGLLKFYIQDFIYLYVYIVKKYITKK